MKGLFTPALLIAALSLSGCDLTLEEKEKLDNAAVDLQQLADQIIITYPAKDSEVSDSMVTVRADIPESAQAQEVRLLVDGIEIAKDSDGAPWEIQWPAYLFADGGNHTLLLKTITGEGNEVRNNEQFQLTVTEEANEALTFEEGINGKSIQEQGSLSFTFAAFERARGYEILVDGNLITSDTAEVHLSNLTVGTHTVQYRVLHDGIDDTPFSEEATFEVLPATLPAINEPHIDGINVTLSWEAISEDDNYEVYWGPEGSSLALMENINTNSYIMTEAGVGIFEWAIRRTNALGQQSLMSNKAIVELIPPSIPIINEPIIEYKEGGYQVTFSWEAVDEGDSYTVYFGKQSEALQAQTASTANFLSISELELGSYQWYLQRTNKFSQSVKGEPQALSVGVFKIQLGGSGDESGRDIIASKNGGSIVLASTKSKGDAQGDDWIIKLDANGNIEWEYVYKDSGSSRLRDLIEFSDGSIYAAGIWNTQLDDKKGMLIKLDGAATSENRLVWEIEYIVPDTDSENFYALTELEGALYVAGRGFTACPTDGSSTTCEAYDNNLHKFDLETGELISTVTIPHPVGALLYGFGNLSTTRSGNLLLACRAKPLVENEDEYIIGYGCLIHFDKAGNLIWSWESSDTYAFLSGRFALETPRGDFILSGEGDFETVSTAIFDSEGKKQSISTTAWGYPFFMGKGLVFNDKNTLRVGYSHESDYPELWSTDQYGNTEIVKVFREFASPYSHPRALAKSKDGSLLTLFEEAQSDNHDDIIIMKTDMQGNR